MTNASDSATSRSPIPAGAPRDTAVAVVGMACRLPGAADPGAFWRLLHDGRNAVTEVPADRWDPRLLQRPDPAAPEQGPIRHGGFLEHVDRFDPGFFGISPRE